MTFAAWRTLLADGLRRGKKRALLAGLGIMAGAGALIFFISLGRGVRDTVLTRLIKDLPAEEVQVTSPALDVGPIQVERPSFLGGGNVLDDRIVESIKGMTVSEGGSDVKAVKAVWRQLDADFPVSLSGNLMGVAYGTDTAVSGVDPEMVLADVKHGEFVYNPASTEIPCLVPKALLEVYNSAFASAQDLPKLNPSFLLGKHFDMRLGESSISSARGMGVFDTRGVIAGLTDRGTLLGVTVPIEYVREWNKRLGKSGDKVGYRMLTVVATDPKYVPAIGDYVRGLGFEARSSTGLSERVSMIIGLVSGGLSLLAILILFVASLNALSIFRLMANEKRLEVGLMMALGATRSAVRALVLAEACVIGLVAGIAGTFGAAVCGWLTNYLFGRLDVAGLLGDSLMSVTFSSAMWGIVPAVLAAIAAAAPAARSLSRLDPAQTLQASE